MTDKTPPYQEDLPSRMKIIRKGNFRFFWWTWDCPFGVYRVWWEWETHLSINLGFFSLTWSLYD